MDRSVSLGPATVVSGGITKGRITLNTNTSSTSSASAIVLLCLHITAEVIFMNP